MYTYNIYVYYTYIHSSTLAISCEELTHWKRLWCWEVLGAGGEGDAREWDGWMASLTRWTWVWVNSGSWWWTGRPGVLRFMGLQRVRHDWATDLIWYIHVYTHPYTYVYIHKHSNDRTIRLVHFLEIMMEICWLSAWILVVHQAQGNFWTNSRSELGDLFPLSFWAAPHSLWDLSSPTSDTLGSESMEY